MSHFSTTVVLILFSVLLLSSVHSSDASRKLLNNNNNNNNNNKQQENDHQMMMKNIKERIPSSLADRMIMNALPKGKVPPSAPSKKNHAMINIDEKLFSAHLARIDRILRSVPSPGMGH